MIETIYFTGVVLLVLLAFATIYIIGFALLAAVLAALTTIWLVLRSYVRNDPIGMPAISLFAFVFGKLVNVRKATLAFSKPFSWLRSLFVSPSPAARGETFDRSVWFTDKEECLAWLASERKPEIWPDIIAGINHDNPDAVDYIKWIVKQPDCDIGTAIVALGLTYCYEAIYLELRAETTELAEIICRNSEAGFYKRNTVGGLVGGRDSLIDPVLILENIHRGCEKHLDDKSKPNVPIPYKILTAELPDQSPKHDYYIEEDGIMHIDDFDERTAKIIRGMNP